MADEVYQTNVYVDDRSFLSFRQARRVADLSFYQCVLRLVRACVGHPSTFYLFVLRLARVC